MSKRVVTRVKLHDLKIIIPGMGNVGTDLPPAAKTIPGLYMEEGTNGIDVLVPGQTVAYVIPYANIQIYYAVPEAKVVTSTAKK